MTGPASGSISAHFQRAREVLRSEGLRSLWFKILGETTYRRLLLMEKGIGSHAGSVHEEATLDCRLLTAKDVDEYAEFRTDANRDTILNRLKDGDFCFLVRDSGTIIHCCWTATGQARIDYLECNIQLAPDAVYVYEVFTSPQYRGRSISSARSLQMERYFLERDFRRLLAAVGPENRPSLRTSEKANFAVVGKIGYLGAGGWKRHFCHYTGLDPAPRLLEKRDSLLWHLFS